MPDPLALLAEPIADAARKLGAEAGAPDVALEQPSDTARGEYATTLALRLARTLRRPPREIAEALGEAARDSRWVSAADVAGAGFLNLRLSDAWYAEVVRLARQPGFGGGTAASPLRVNVEYVSANPTGPLPVSAGRNAAYGDSLARLLEFAGHDVTREYYFNDAGAQIDQFGASLRARARGEEVPEDGYQGEYLKDIVSRTGLGPDADADAWARAGVEAMFAEIRATLERFRVRMDRFTNEADLHVSGGVTRARERAMAVGHVYEKDAALWLRTTDFGDDKDRVIARADGTPTYFGADLAYLVDKLERGYDRAVYVLGADHHGYVARLGAAAAALGYDPARVHVPIYQMVHLREGGVQRRMSKRRGDVVLLDELMDAIGVDASRYFLVQRSHDQTIEIDLELAREQGPKNPVYYVQYAHARIAAILRNAGAEAAEAREDAGLTPEPSEAALIREIARFGEVCATACELEAPHRVVAYAHELAAAFHVFYRDCRVLDPDDPRHTRARLALCDAARRTVAQALDLVGVSAPDEM